MQFQGLLVRFYKKKHSPSLRSAFGEACNWILRSLTMALASGSDGKWDFFIIIMVVLQHFALFLASFSQPTLPLL